MITFDEMRKIAELRKWNDECRKELKAVEVAAIRAQDISSANMANATLNLCKAIEWFVQLIERETEILCNTDDIAIAEHREHIRRGLAQRNWG